MKRMLAPVAVAAIFTVSANGQGFVNLNFESAYNLPANPPENGELVSVTNALPGWTAFNGNLALAEVYYGSNSLSYASGAELEGGNLALRGDYSLGLYEGGYISQTGLVPGNAESLQFEASTYFNLYVYLGGQALSYSALSEGSGYTVFGANIPAGMDGQGETLTFLNNGEGVGILLDNIEFSTTGVPEPGEWAMVGVGVVLFGIFRWRRHGGILNKEGTKSGLIH